jgi:hypothetical protein
LLSFDDKLARVTVGDGTPLSGIWSRATEGRSRAVRFRQGARFRSDRLCRSHRRPLSAQPEMARMPVARVEVQRPEGPESTLSGHNDPGLGRLDWADSAPPGVASGRTGVRAIAVVPWKGEIFTALSGPTSNAPSAPEPRRSRAFPASAQSLRAQARGRRGRRRGG